MAAAKIKKGDQVIVLSGKDKGKTGTVTQAMPKDGKVDRRRRQRRHAPHASRPRPIRRAASRRSRRRCTSRKVAHVTADGKPTRVRFEVQDGKKVRVAVKTGSEDRWLMPTSPA